MAKLKNDNKSKHNDNFILPNRRTKKLKPLSAVNKISRSQSTLDGKGLKAAKNAAQIKVLGMDSQAFLLTLVSYDTIKTLRGIIFNHLKSEGKVNTISEFNLFVSFPRRKLDRSKDAMTLAELKLIPNSVIHVAIPTY